MQLEAKHRIQVDISTPRVTHTEIVDKGNILGLCSNRSCPNKGANWVLQEMTVIVAVKELKSERLVRDTPTSNAFSQQLSSTCHRNVLCGRKHDEKARGPAELCRRFRRLA